MKLYQVTTRQVSPFQVDFPNEKTIEEGGKSKKVPFERTKQGSLHFRPGAAALVSFDEYEFLLKNFKAKIIFNGEVKEAPKKKAPQPPKPVEVVEAPKPQQQTKAKKKKS